MLGQPEDAVLTWSRYCAKLASQRFCHFGPWAMGICGCICGVRSQWQNMGRICLAESGAQPIWAVGVCKRCGYHCRCQARGRQGHLTSSSSCCPRRAGPDQEARGMCKVAQSSGGSQCSSSCLPGRRSCPPGGMEGMLGASRLQGTCQASLCLLQHILCMPCSQDEGRGFVTLCPATVPLCMPEPGCALQACPCAPAGHAVLRDTGHRTARLFPFPQSCKDHSLLAISARRAGQWVAPASPVTPAGTGWFPGASLGWRTSVGLPG